MAYGEELRGAYVFKYVQNKVLSFHHQNEELSRVENLDDFISKYKDSWAVEFSSFDIEEKVDNKTIYALFDENKIKKANMIFETDSQGNLLSLIIDPISK